MLKKLLIFLYLFVIVFFALAQNTHNDGVSQNYKLVKYDDCIEVFLADSSDYSHMDIANKKKRIDSVLQRHKTERVVVRYGYYRDVWTYSKDSGYTLVVEKNINEFTPVAFQKYTDREYTKCDFFTYVGGAMDFNSSYFSFTTTVRSGCYFFKRLLDCSITYSYTISVMEGSSFSTMNLGLIGRVYPFYKMESLQKIRLSPYVGIEGALYTTFIDKKASYSGNFVGHIGVSWLIGPGSLDFGIQSGIKEYFSATIGYSFCPALLPHHRKKSKQ